MSEKGEMSCREAGRKGGMRTKERQAPEFFRENGKKGARRIRELIEQGKREERQADE